MAASLTSLVLGTVVRPVGFRVLQRILSMPMPNLTLLRLGKNFQVPSKKLINIVGNCRNLSSLTMNDCKNIEGQDMMILTKLDKLKMLVLEYYSRYDQHTADMLFLGFSIYAPKLVHLLISFSGISDTGVSRLADLKHLQTLELAGCRMLQCYSKLY